MFLKIYDCNLSQNIFNINQNMNDLKKRSLLFDFDENLSKSYNNNNNQDLVIEAVSFLSDKNIHIK